MRKHGEGARRLPTRQEAIQLLVQSGCEPHVIQHCKAVAALARRIAEAIRRRGVKVNVLEIGALLHDIGRSKTHSVHHVAEGARIARSLGLPEELVSIIERHVGGGITAEEARRLGLPVKDYIPKTLEEKIVNYADKLIEGTRVVPIERTLEKFSRELGSNHPAIQRIRRLHQEISSMAGDLNAIDHPS